MAERWQLRSLTAADAPFLWEMLYQAIYVAPGDTPPERGIVRQPDLARYMEGWGRPGDRGVIALDAGSGAPAGAAWLRLWPGAERGYGFVDPAVPELTIAVQPQTRGLGLGTRLLRALLAAAAGHYPAISLSVAEANPARRLYTRLGFVEAGRAGDTLLMVKRFDQSSSLSASTV